MHDFIVREARADDETGWRVLWRGYNEFYESSVSEPVTAKTWSRILDPTSNISALIAADKQNGVPIGFANYVIHPFTWGVNDVCYLEDLFTGPAARKRGVGRALIQHLLDMAEVAGWERVYWMTKEDNQTARSLYDHFSKADDFVRYVVET